MKCKYCGKSTGLFSTAHKECKLIHKNSVDSLKDLIHNSLESNPNYTELCSLAADVMKKGYISSAEFDDVFFSEVLAILPKAKQPYPLLRFIATLPPSLLSKFKKSYLFTSVRDRTLASIVNEAITVPHINKNELSTIEEIAENTGYKEFNEQILVELENRIKKYLDDGIISLEEEQAVDEYLADTGIRVEDISHRQVYTDFIQSLVLRDIKEGKEPNRVTFSSLPILVSKKEYPIWAYTNVIGYEEKTGRKYVGGSRGTSIRLCKGVYYRVGGSKGHSVDYQYSQELGVGSLIVTNKAVYFVSSSNTVKILISKIVSIEPYSDGISIIKDGVRAHPVYFVGFDSWFIMNLLPLLTD